MIQLAYRFPLSGRERIFSIWSSVSTSLADSHDAQSFVTNNLLVSNYEFVVIKIVALKLNFNNSNLFDRNCSLETSSSRSRLTELTRLWKVSYFSLQIVIFETSSRAHRLIRFAFFRRLAIALFCCSSSSSSSKTI